MTTRNIYDWLCASPLLENEKLNLDHVMCRVSMVMPQHIQCVSCAAAHRAAYQDPDQDA